MDGRLRADAGLQPLAILFLPRRLHDSAIPKVKIGFVPAMVAAILRRNLGEKKSFELLTQGVEYSAEEAVALGLVNRIFDEEGFENAVLEYASVYTKVSGSAVAMTKRLLYDIDAHKIADAIEQGVVVNAKARMTEDCRSVVWMFFDEIAGVT